jgi:hypothetical protein
MEVNLENHEERSTGPSLKEHEVTCPPLCERVMLEMEYSLPCALESLPLTNQCPHLSNFPLTLEYSSSFPLTKRDFHIQPCSQLEPPYKPLFLNDLTSEVNRLNYYVIYISPIDLWMEEVCGGMNQLWYSLALALER